MLAFVSNYLVGGLVGHRYTALYGPHGIDVRETVKAIEGHRDLVKGIKAHGEVGGYSRWGVETMRLAKDASRRAKVPLGEVVRMVTANAAALVGLEGEIGTLAPGAAAAVSVLALEQGEWTLADSLGAELRATVRLRPELAVRGGIVHRADSPLLLEPARRAA